MKIQENKESIQLLDLQKNHIKLQVLKFPLKIMVNLKNIKISKFKNIRFFDKFTNQNPKFRNPKIPQLKDKHSCLFLTSETL